MIKKWKFDDYLNLIDYDFSKYKYIVFVWNSWSGKSSYIKELVKKNSSLGKNIVIIDEIFDLIDFLKLFKLFSSREQFIVASHISIKYFYLFRFLWNIKYIKTDNHHNKICNYLQCKKLRYTKNTVKNYIKIFSATYTDIDIIIEKYNWNNFDEAFNNFIKFNKVKLTWNKKNK